jgi:hypothetical protein
MQYNKYGRNLLIFWKNLISPSSESDNNPKKQKRKQKAEYLLVFGV